MNEILIQYQGFQPSEFTRSYLDLKLSAIHEQAPKGSIVRAVFKRRSKTLTGTVRIMSAAGQFFATASGAHLREVTHLLAERVRRRLRRYKTLRHHRRAL